MTITTADLVAAYGAYYINQGQNASRLKKLLYYADNKMDMLATTVPTTDTQYRAARSTVTSLLQGFQKNWTPKGDMTISPSPIQLRQSKIDVSIWPDEIVETFAGFLASVDEKDRSKWPLIRWVLEEHLIPKMNEEYALEASYLGVYAAPVADVASAANTVVDGVRKVINDHITAGDITPIVTGAPDIANPVTLVGQIEDFVKAMNFRYRGKQMQLACSLDVHDAYREGVGQKYNQHYAQADETRVHRHPNITLVGCPEMGASHKIFCTPKENFVKPTRGTSNKDVFLIDKDVREVKLTTDWWTAYGFIVPAAVFTNDQDLV